MHGYSYQFIQKVRTLAEENDAPVGVELGLEAITRNISIKYISSKVGVSRMAVYDWFTGKYEPNARHLKKLTAAINGK
jgi:predicted DNA-binding transcriptional regulator AlpA